MAVELVVFDMAGTTMDDTVNGLPLVTIAMQDAFKKNGHNIDPGMVNEFRGMEKKDAIKNILQRIPDNKESEKQSSFVDTVFDAFKESLNNHLSSIDKEIPGTTETFRFLKSKGIQIAVGSGFPHSVVESIVTALGWRGVVDYVSSAEKEGHGRPNPAMIHAAMKFCGVQEVQSVVKVGDTKVDVEEGKNAGSWTVAVLTGTQTEETLRAANPDYIITSVANLPSVLRKITAKQR